MSCECSQHKFHRWTVELCCIRSVCTGVWSLGEGYRWTWFRGGVVWCRSEVSVRWHCSETCWSLEPSTPESHLEVLPFIPSFMRSVNHFTTRSNHLCIIPLKVFLSQSIHWELIGWRATDKPVATTIYFVFHFQTTKPSFKMLWWVVRLSNGF